MKVKSLLMMLLAVFMLFALGCDLDSLFGNDDEDDKKDPTSPTTTVSLSYPANESTEQSTTITFKWSCDASLFDVYLGTSPSNLSKIAGNYTSSSYTKSDLAPGTKYYWKVVVNIGGVTIESPVRSFTTKSSSTYNFNDDFNDGNFTDNPVWKLWNNDDYPGKATVESGYVLFERSGAGGNGGAVYLEKEITKNITSNTRIKFDVNPIFSDVGNGAGWYDEEYPIYVQLYLKNSSGEEKILKLAYNYRGGKSKNYSNIVQIAFPNCTQNEWKRNEIFAIKDYVSDAVELTKITVGGCGWNFKGALDNISVGEESSTTFFSEDYESYTVGTLPSDYYIRYNGSGDSYQKVIQSGSTKCLQLVSATNWAVSMNKKFDNDLPSVTKGSVDIKFATDCSNYSYGNTNDVFGKFVELNNFGIKNKANKGFSFSAARLASDGNYYILCDGKKYKVNNDEWITISYEVDFNNNKYEIKVNGNLFCSGSSLFTVTDFSGDWKTTDGSACIFLHVGNSASLTGLFDNIKITN